MKELLNELIKRGWKPRNKEEVKRLNYHTLYREVVSLEFDNYNLGVSYSIRDLVSKESGLRQFCVENNLINKYADLGPDVEEAYIGKWKSGLDAIDIDGNYIRLDDDYDEYHQDTDYKYWLIQSSLIDEDKLEQFLLDNIKVDG